MAKGKKPSLHSGPSGDGSLDVANKGYVIVFVHIPTREKVAFKAFLTAFSDTYSANWEQETVYGRMDPLTVYRGTTRRITLGWKTLAYDIDEAKHNLNCVQQLIKMQYPTFHQQGDNKDKPSIIHKPPLLRMRFSNWVISNQGSNPSDENLSTKLFSATGTPTGDKGLIGHLGAVSFEPEMEVGFFDQSGNLFPKQINLSGEYTVIHEHNVGWYKGGGGGYTFGQKTNIAFPYGSSLFSTQDVPKTADKSKNPNATKAKTKKVTQAGNK